MAEPLYTETMVMNMGPHHPSTHGVCRLILTIDGEVIKDCVPVIGYLHRAIEKICVETLPRDTRWRSRTSLDLRSVSGQV